VFSVLEDQSDYLPLAAGFFATGALVALAAPVFAFVDLAAFAGLAAPVFALVDFAAAGAGLAAAVFALVDFAAVVFAGVLFAAMTNFLREDSVTPMKFAGCSPVSGRTTAGTLEVAVGPNGLTCDNLFGVIGEFRRVRQAEILR